MRMSPLKEEGGRERLSGFSHAFRQVPWSYEAPKCDSKAQELVGLACAPTAT